ncbi:hypothetical protein IG631_04031 [Alternaria alternata]|nr:hypothetical protein IG631_04031 [Alternaria alternata]
MAAGGLILLHFYNEASTAPTILEFSARECEGCDQRCDSNHARRCRKGLPDSDMVENVDWEYRTSKVQMERVQS